MFPPTDDTGILAKLIDLATNPIIEPYVIVQPVVATSVPKPESTVPNVAIATNLQIVPYVPPTIPAKEEEEESAQVSILRTVHPVEYADKLKEQIRYASASCAIIALFAIL